MTVKVVTTPGNYSPRGFEVTCPECGHKWFSRGKGKYARCPECYKNRTGKELGSHFKNTKGLTITVVGNNHVGHEEQEQNQNHEEKDLNNVTGDGNGLKALLRKPIFKI